MAGRRRPKEYRRPIYGEVVERAEEPRRFLQVLAGPRQVGKTTLARQVMDAIGIPGHFASADALAGSSFSTRSRRSATGRTS